MTKTGAVLDWEEDEILTFSYGYLHPPNMRYMGFGILLFGVYAAFQTIYLVPFMALAGSWMAFRKSGIQIQVKNRLWRE